MNEKQVQDFWEANPCGDMRVGGLKQFGDRYSAFFDAYDNARYQNHRELLHCLDSIDFKEKHVLEIGLGQGADSEQIIRRGAIWSGIDLTHESVSRVEMRMQLRGLPYNEIKQGTVLDLPFSDNSFDKVYSFGVLHHVPDILQAQKEIDRVLKPGGELIAMFYAKVSLNYLISIFLFRRLALLGMYFFGIEGKPGSKVYQHLKNAKEVGILNYLKMGNFIHRNTDGPLNPYSKVYALTDVKMDFPSFEIVQAYKNFMHAPPLHLKWLPGKSLLGWHLWVHMRTKKTA